VDERKGGEINKIKEREGRMRSLGTTDASYGKKGLTLQKGEEGNAQLARLKEKVNQ
jgi:hypothetical protein